MFCDQFNMGNADYSVPVIKTHSVILYLENSVKSWSEKNLTFFFFSNQEFPILNGPSVFFPVTSFHGLRGKCSSETHSWEPQLKQN